MLQIQPLRQDQRLDAREAALLALQRSIGNEPQREEFAQHSASKYPRYIVYTIMVLCIMLLLSAFTPSALRLFRVGAIEFASSVPEAGSIFAVGLATVLTAEIAQVVFSLAFAIVPDASRMQRVWLLFMASLATAIALVGNVTVANPHDLFTWLEALAPPLIVLGTAYVLKEQWLNAIEQRHANELAYQIAIAEWKRLTSNLEHHADWTRFYANAIRDAIRIAQGRGKRAKEMLAALTNTDWSLLVHRELQSEEWYAAPVMLAPVQRSANGSVNGRLTGEVVQALQNAETDASGVTVQCPDCEWNTTRDNAKSARLALTAHSKKHFNAEMQLHLHNGNGKHPQPVL
jgi:hypothetical protein